MTDTTRQKILDTIDRNRDKAITFLQDMIRIPSVTGDEAAIQRFLSDYMRKIGLDVDMWETDWEKLKIELTAREFQLLEFMMRHSGQVVTRTMLLEGVWDYHFDPQTNVIDVHISRLRQAIDKDFDRPLLHTVRGAGYSLREDE